MRTTAAPNLLRQAFLAALPLLSLAGAAPATAGVIHVGDVHVGGASLYIGDPGLGSVSVTGGSTLDAAAGLGAFVRIAVGVAPAGNGQLTIDGSGSRVVTTAPVTEGGLTVGFGGSGRLEVINGGTADVNRLDVVQFQPATGNTGFVRVDGAGSRIDSLSTFNVGVHGTDSTVLTATAEITGGGSVNAQTSVIGSASGSNGKVTVTGASSTLNLLTGAVTSFGRAFLNVGLNGTGQLDVLDGGKVRIEAAPSGTNSTGMNIGRAGGGGTLTIDGTGSELRIAGERPVTTIGREGTGTVNITGGGKLITEDTGTSNNAYVGRTATGSGTVNISGTGSEWRAGRRLWIGSDQSSGNPQPGGTGLVTVSDGGTLSVAGAGSQVYIGAGGTLSGNGVIRGELVNEGMIRPGNSPGILSHIGNLTLNPAGIVEIELGGADIALAEYDQINVYDDAATRAVDGGTLALGGTLRVSLFGGFLPVAGSVFDIFTALDIIDGTPVYELPGLSAGLRWTHSVIDIANGREALRLAVLEDRNLPAPGSLSLLALALGAIVVTRRR